jgi:methylated-DNA-[protein]-cysteine S-methyltransferase
MQSCDELRTPLGLLYLIVSGSALAGLAWERPSLRVERAPEEMRGALEQYFEGALREFAFPISVECGTEFERRVWLELRAVPYGETRSYRWLAERVGSPRGARAVGQALSRNPLPIVLPCHRIVEARGRIGGYSSGTDRKRRLLDLEYYCLRGARDKGTQAGSGEAPCY